MRADDETTAVQLHSLLRDKWYLLSFSTILCSRRSLGWTFRGSAYCHLIQEVNKTKRLECARQYEHEAETGFLDMVYTDETSIQLETHRRYCCRKCGEPPRNKPRPKHPVKVHVWAGISVRGRTGVWIFDGTMDADAYDEILRQTLLPFSEMSIPMDINS